MLEKENTLKASKLGLQRWWLYTPDNPSLMPGAHVVERENGPTHFLVPPRMPSGTQTPQMLPAVSVGVRDHKGRGVMQKRRSLRTLMLSQPTTQQERLWRQSHKPSARVLPPLYKHLTWNTSPNMEELNLLYKAFRRCIQMGKESGGCLNIQFSLKLY